MDPFSAFKSEVFRPLAAVVMPGLLAVVPYVVIACNANPDINSFYLKQTLWFMAGVLAVATALGLFIENLGSSIERGIDRCIDHEYLPGHNSVWSLYLSCGQVDSNGRRYLASIVTRLKYINSMMPAVFLFSVGMVLLDLQVDILSGWSMIAFVVLTISTLTWLFRTSTELSEVASNTRYCLLVPEQRPKEYDSNAVTVRRFRHFCYVLGELATSRVDSIDLKGKAAIWVVPDAFCIFFGLKKTKA
ncbi:hypothetical protein MUU75_00835 [Pseudoxanthomonas mexicana]|uniref:hypothetical protein n=1 Tax=Pseudoxanthomonas mexicana TaxID=128785 RepID=UPI001FD6C843|nr:hypothetical protein [Pseudoxanthomonas mexicana]UOV05321.1 hypothetical protein MUU75_00835 [Pseudoxanthomonas mexicana]